MVEIGIYNWKFDGLFTDSLFFVDIIREFICAKNQILHRQWNKDKSIKLFNFVRKKHPLNRGLDTGFFLLDANIVK